MAAEGTIGETRKTGASTFVPQEYVYMVPALLGDRTEVSVFAEDQTEYYI